MLNLSYIKNLLELLFENLCWKDSNSDGICFFFLNIMNDFLHILCCYILTFTLN